MTSGGQRKASLASLSPEMELGDHSQPCGMHVFISFAFKSSTGNSKLLCGTRLTRSVEFCEVAAQAGGEIS